MDINYARYLLQKSREDYNIIAEDFSAKRSYISDDMRILSEYASSGDGVLDLGCGNGRFFELLKDKNIKYVGADVSQNLVNIAKSRHPEAEFLTTDFLQLPFSDNSFDKIYCLSVFHHIPSKEFRLQFLVEAKRALKPGGILILSAWKIPWSEWKEGVNVLKFALLKLTGKNKMDFGDILRPFKDSAGKTLTDRYFHCFSRRGLIKNFKKAGLRVEKSGILKRGRHENIYIIGKK